MSRGESGSPQVTSYGSERLVDYIIIVRGAERVVRIVRHSENGYHGLNCQYRDPTTDGSVQNPA